jgi:hypothetical protein
MSIAQLSLPDLIGVTLGFIFTLMVFSYIFGDNVLFRIAIYIFIGVSAGYAAVVAFYNVIWPQMLQPLIFGTQSDRLYVLFPSLFGVLLLFKASPRFTRIGNPAIAYLVGVGVATMIGGAVVGTIFPQVQASINVFDEGAYLEGSSVIGQLFKGSVILIGTLATLIYFHFGVRRKEEQSPTRPQWVEWIAWVGQIFIAITFGAVFAGVYTAALTAFIERLNFIIDFLFSIIPA